MSANAIYQRASDNVAAGGTLTASSEADGYPAEYLVDLKPQRPSKLDGTTGNWVWEFSSPQRIDLVAIIHHNLDAGLDVRFQGNATNVWGGPTLNEAFTIPSAREDGYPVNPWLDLTGATGYSVSGFRFWRLVVVGVNSADVSIGEVWLGETKRTLDPNISWDATEGEERKAIVHETEFDIDQVYDLGVTIRSLTGEIDATDVARESFNDWWRSVRGRARPHLLIPYGEDVNDAWLVKFKNTLKDIDLVLIDRNTIKVEVREMGRGLVP